MEGVELHAGLSEAREIVDGATEERAAAPRHDEMGRVEGAAADVGTDGSIATVHERPRIRIRHGDTMGWEEEVARELARTVARPVYSWDRCADHEASDRGGFHRH